MKETFYFEQAVRLWEATSLQKKWGELLDCLPHIVWEAGRVPTFTQKPSWHTLKVMLDLLNKICGYFQATGGNMVDWFTDGKNWHSWKVFRYSKSKIKDKKIIFFKMVIRGLQLFWNHCSQHTYMLSKHICSGAPWVRKCGKLPFRENHVTVHWPSVHTTGLPSQNFG